MQRFKTTLSLSSMIFFLYKNQKILFKNKANPSKLGMYHGHKTIKIPITMIKQIGKGIHEYVCTVKLHSRKL